MAYDKDDILIVTGVSTGKFKAYMLQNGQLEKMRELDTARLIQSETHALIANDETWKSIRLYSLSSKDEPTTLEV